HGIDGDRALATHFLDPLTPQKHVHSGDFMAARSQMLRQWPAQITVNSGDKNSHAVSSETWSSISSYNPGCPVRLRFRRRFVTFWQLLPCRRCLRHDRLEGRDISFSRQQFGVENGTTRRAANGIVRQRHKLEAQNGAATQAANRGRHALAGVAVAPWLRSINLRQILQ